MGLNRIALTLQDMRGYRQVRLTVCRMNEVATPHGPEPRCPQDGPPALAPGKGALNGKRCPHPAATITPARGHQRGHDWGCHRSELARLLPPWA